MYLQLKHYKLPFRTADGVVYDANDRPVMNTLSLEGCHNQEYGLNTSNLKASTEDKSSMLDFIVEMMNEHGEET